MQVSSCWLHPLANVSLSDHFLAVIVMKEREVVGSPRFAWALRCRKTAGNIYIYTFALVLLAAVSWVVETGSVFRVPSSATRGKVRALLSRMWGSRRHSSDPWLLVFCGFKYLLTFLPCIPTTPTNSLPVFCLTSSRPCSLMQLIWLTTWQQRFADTSFINYPTCPSQVRSRAVSNPGNSLALLSSIGQRRPSRRSPAAQRSSQGHVSIPCSLTMKLLLLPHSFHCKLLDFSTSTSW